MLNSHIDRLVLVEDFTKRIVGFDFCQFGREEIPQLYHVESILHFISPLHRYWLERSLNLIVIYWVITHNVSMLRINEMLMTLILRQVVNYKEFDFFFSFYKKEPVGQLKNNKRGTVYDLEVFLFKSPTFAA